MEYLSNLLICYYLLYDILGLARFYTYASEEKKQRKRSESKSI